MEFEAVKLLACRVQPLHFVQSSWLRQAQGFCFLNPRARLHSTSALSIK